MARQKEWQLMMAAMVAVVAVVGLVVYFGGATGAYNVKIFEVPYSTAAGAPYQVDVNPAFFNYGYGTLGPSCIEKESYAESRHCCTSGCQNWCEGKDRMISGRTASECKDACESGCELSREELVKTGGKIQGLLN
ncbi:MAG: hypothetical protein ACE5FT_04200 [Candidatus Nanoarchaeia archaeon]